MVALLTMLLGYGFIRENLQSPRPYSLLAPSQMLDTEDNHRVESRLWQDPFEPFESSTNQTDVAGKALSRALLDNWTNDIYQLLWNDITNRAANNRIAILGVMLPGGSYGEDKEVRLRLRYAVELALLTKDVGPEDSTHIYTNSVWLNRIDFFHTNVISGTNVVIRYGIDPESRLSQYSYEWFKTTNDPAYGPRTNNFQACVLWLNEDDFADDPASRLGSLLTNIPALTTGTNVSFYLIGPRASDTLQALAYTDKTKLSHALYTSLTNAADLHHFYILSPEATASVLPANANDEEDKGVSLRLGTLFSTNVFYNWIATDERIANLISRELVNRLDSPTVNSNNVVVLLSEQDTYYGRKLADEWTWALVTNGVCADAKHVWQFSYLRGLDGSKPQAQTPDQPPALPNTPEAALQTAMQQQQGERADGDAQLDYIIRLGEFLKERDDELKSQGGGRIIAVGLTGSDAYDKLILLEQLRRKFPEAVFFTSDLDAPLWTAQEQRYTRNLLIGSAYSVNPMITQTSTQSTSDQFTSFRDVYQTAVFRACLAVVKYEKTGNAGFLNDHDLQGGLYKIGRHGPVPLSIISGAGEPPEPDPFLARWLPLVLMLAAFAVMLVYFTAGCSGGIERPEEINQDHPSSSKIRKAEENERLRQISYGKLLAIFICIMLAGLVGLGFQYWTWTIAMSAGEEPWGFMEGASIWPSEYVRLLVVYLVFVFFYVAHRRRQRHRRKLWKKYFREDANPNQDEDEDENLDESWKAFQEKCMERWKDDLAPRKKREIAESDGYQLWKKSGKPSGKNLKDWIAQAETELERERKSSLIFSWMPPFIEVHKAGMPREVCVNATALFRGYLNLGQFKKRIKRMCFCVAIYFMLAASLVLCLHDVPTLWLIRGSQSHLFDKFMLLTVVSGTLFVLFYVFDSVLLTKRVLDYISRHATCWPEPALRQNAIEFGVKPEHLDALLDVDFAAVQTAEIGPLMFGPIILQLLLLISRSPCFDDWTWPTGLILIFVINFLAAGICWFVVRAATSNVRNDARKRINKAISSVKNSSENSYFVVPAAGPPESTKRISPTEYLNNLGNVQNEIEGEKRGAFANWFQDPTYLAVFIPSGATGVITLVGTFLLRK